VCSYEERQFGCKDCFHKLKDEVNRLENALAAVRHERDDAYSRLGKMKNVTEKILDNYRARLRALGESV